MQQHPRRAAKGQLASQHLVENHAGAGDIVAAIDVVSLAEGLLRAHVGRGAEALNLRGHRAFAAVALGEAQSIKRGVQAEPEA
jgi:hypothetical protein